MWEYNKLNESSILVWNSFESVWYYRSFCGCGLKKKYFIKSTFDKGWFGIYVCLVKTVVEINVEQKVV